MVEWDLIRVFGVRKIAHVPVQTWKALDSHLFAWLPGGPCVKGIPFDLECAVATLLFDSLSDSMLYSTYKRCCMLLYFLAQSLLPEVCLVIRL